MTENPSQKTETQNLIGAPVLITACQCRAARAMLRWTVAELSRESGVAEKTIWRIEKDWGIPTNVTVDTLLRIQDAFVRQGITFILEDNDPTSPGPGVRFASYPGRRLVPRRQP